MKGEDWHCFFITLLFSFALRRRRSIADGWRPVQKQQRLIDRRLSWLSAAVTISCLTPERDLLISFLGASWSLSGSRVIRDAITDLALQTWIQQTNDEGKNIRSSGLFSGDSSLWGPPKAEGHIHILQDPVYIATHPSDEDSSANELLRGKLKILREVHL